MQGFRCSQSFATGSRRLPISVFWPRGRKNPAKAALRQARGGPEQRRRTGHSARLFPFMNYPITRFDRSDDVQEGGRNEGGKGRKGGRGWKVEEVCVLLRRREGRRQPQHEGSARRKG